MGEQGGGGACLVAMLSDELLLLIFQKMAWKELRVTCMPVCRWWCEVARDASLWRELCRSRFPAVQEQSTEQGRSAMNWPVVFQEKQTELVRDMDKKLLYHYDICAKKHRGCWQGVSKDCSRVPVAIKQYDHLSYSKTALAIFKKVMMLKALRRHPNIMTLVDVLGRDDELLDSCWVVYRSMDTSLDFVIRASILQEIHTQYITYQLLMAVRHVHSASIIHCNIQPRSIFINENCTIALSRFGEHAMVVLSGESPPPYPNDKYVLPKWYSPPERLLGSTVVKTSHDMWQVGLLLGEMLKGQPLLTGNSTMHQLELISALTNPSADDVSAIESPYAESMMEAISSGGVGHGCRSLEEACPQAAQSAIDLLRGLLQFNPAKRLTVDEALAHPFIAEFPTPAPRAGVKDLHPWLVHGVPGDVKPPGIRQELLDRIREWKQNKARKEERKQRRREERKRSKEET